MAWYNRRKNPRVLFFRENSHPVQNIWIFFSITLSLPWYLYIQRNNNSFFFSVIFFTTRWSATKQSMLIWIKMFRIGTTKCWGSQPDRQIEHHLLTSCGDTWCILIDSIRKFSFEGRIRLEIFDILQHLSHSSKMYPCQLSDCIYLQTSLN